MTFIKFLYLFIFWVSSSKVTVFFTIFLMLALAASIPVFLIIREEKLRIIREDKYSRYVTRKIHDLVNKDKKISPEEFFEIRQEKRMTNYNLPGIYILHNETKDMYYVGQGKKVFDRVNHHFSGRGNGDVYADYKYNDTFKISIIPLELSGFLSLNELEKETIKTYNSYGNGYNKTQGNKG